MSASSAALINGNGSAVGSSSSSNSTGTMTPFDQLKEIVRLILSSWPSYQFAIKNQLGGAQTSAKNEWFIEVLSEHLYNKSDLYTLELSEWIDQIVDSEFDTISDDGTVEPTAKLLIQMSNWLLGRAKGVNAQEARQKLEENIQRLKGMSSNKACFAPPQKAEESSSSEEDDDGQSDDDY